MKKIFTICITSLLILFLFQACTQEELVTINDPLELDENSLQYQQYMEERAIELIKSYRFDQLGNTIDRIKDPVVKEKILALLTEYRTIAFNEALYIAKPTNDTLFFFPPNVEDRKEAKGITLNYTMNSMVTLNEIGVLHGFKNFPKLELLIFYNSLVTSIKDLNTLPELKRFDWRVDAYDFSQRYPDIELTPSAVDFDFSQNNKLEDLLLEYVEMGKMKYPVGKIKTGTIRDAIVNKGEDIDVIAANNLAIYGASKSTELTLKSRNIDSLTLYLDGLSSLDISGASMLKLDLSYKENLEKIKLNEGLKKLVSFRAGKLTEKPNFPKSLQELYIENYSLSDKNFSILTNLNKMTLGSEGFDGLTLPTNIEEILFTIPWPYTAKFGSGFNRDYSNLTKLKKVIINNIPINQTGLIFPANLEYLEFKDYTSGNKISGTGDYSNISNLKTFRANHTVEFEFAPKLPPYLSTLYLYRLILPTGATFDISNLTNLEFLNISMSSPNPITLILPTNLAEDAVKAGSALVGGVASLLLPKGSTIVNEPEWLSKYVQLY